MYLIHPINPSWLQSAVNLQKLPKDVLLLKQAMPKQQEKHR